MGTFWKESIVPMKWSIMKKLVRQDLTTLPSGVHSPNKGALL